MKQLKKASFSILLFSLFLTANLYAQAKHHAFWKQVQTIKKYDKIYEPPAHPILFIGSSSIRKWPNPQKAFCKHVILGRGIGGAVIDDDIYYADDIIFSYHPKQLVIYVGENDEINKNETAEIILNRFKKFYHLLRSKLPNIPIDYISMKPSPSREQFWGKEKKANALIAKFIKKQKHIKFINIWPLMVTKDGKPRRDLFQKDMLHMNAKGYAIWERILRSYLVK
jgi:lysophospholipase L1-like esterase